MSETNGNGHGNGNGSLASLPAVVEPYRAAAPVPAPVWELEPEEPGIPLSQYLWILKRHRWKILASIALCVLATTIVSLRLTPSYESTTTVDIDRRVPTGILGQEAIQSELNDADEFMGTQVKLIQSDSVLRPIATKYRLRELEKGISDEALLTNTQREAPVVLKKLNVTRPPNTYILLISYRSPDRQLSADVANAIAQSYLEHSYNIRYKAAAGLSQFMEKQLEELKAKMERSSGALAQFERDLSVINPEEKTNIISARLLQLNTEYTNAQADRVKKEAAFASVQGGTLEAAAVSSQGDALKKLTERLNESQEKFADAKTRYGANHPEYRKAETQVTEAEHQLEETKNSIGQRVEIEYKESLARESMLEKAVMETKGEFDRLNARSFDYQRLKQEAEGDKKLYDELIRKIKEAGINASFQNSSIRIADLARPAYKPVFPNIPLNVALAFFLSGLLAVGVAVVGDALDNTARDPEQVMRILKTEVIGSLPMIKSLRGHLMPAFRSHKFSEIAPIVKQADQSFTNFDEAIRTLRNSILLTDFDRRLRSVLMTSASPAEGKSTVAAHLALAHAEQGYRTLLIDGDLRRPSVHKLFEVSTNIGLSKVLLYDFPWHDALLRPRDDLELYILPAGPATRRGADLVGRGLAGLLDEVSQEFDLVIVDAPPLLGFPEPLQMAAAVDGVIVVARAGQTNRSAVSTVLGTLSRLRANVVGLVLNEVHREVSAGYYYYHGHYNKYYRQAAHE